MTVASIVFLVLLAVIFVALWQKGQLRRFAVFARETQEELKKCAWPTKDELVGSTVVVFVSLLVLGLFTGLVDFVVTLLVRSLSNI